MFLAFFSANLISEFRLKRLLITAGAGLFVFTSCATKREVPFRVHPGAPPTGKMAKFDYSLYPRIPDTLSEFTYRTVQRAIPWTRKHAFRGNWAGSGWGSGLPIDAMDEVFRMHDIVYAECRSSRTLRWADAACIESLSKLDAQTLSGEASEFRKLATWFFTNRALNWLGKPPQSFLFRREAKDCPFQIEDDVRRLYGLDSKNTKRTRS